MVKRIVPSNVRDKIINLPSSKSIAHRALIILSFSAVRSKIYNVTFNDDVLATIRVLKNLGIKFKKIDSSTLEIDSSGVFLKTKNDFNVKESGTTLRLLIPFLASLNEEIEIHTEGNLINRPLDVYEKLFNKDYDTLEVYKKDNLIKIHHRLIGDSFTVKGDVSSQFISGLLLYEALLLKSGELTVLKPFESKAYVDLTVDMLSYFGFEFSTQDNKESVYYRLKKTPVRLHSYNEYIVEADYSSLAFLIALGTINNDLTLKGVNQISLQADRKIIDILQRMGGKISFVNKDELSVKKSTLTPAIIDLKECPDLGPILMAVASTINGKTRFINTKRLAYKESDRAKAMKNELEKLGAKVTIKDNEIIVEGVKELPKGEIFESHNDHRITMSLAVIATILKTPSYFKNTDCVNKSYPEFFNDLEKLGIGVKNA